MKSVSGCMNNCFYKVVQLSYRMTQSHYTATFFLITRGPCPLLALLVNPRLQGLRPLQPMLAKSHLFLANIEQILIGFVYMRDQEKK